jgi:hypothetical protein
MKTIRNKTNGKIERVKDKDAEPKIKFGWEYISKTEWKNQFKTPKIETNGDTDSKKQRKKTA